MRKLLYRISVPLWTTRLRLLTTNTLTPTQVYDLRVAKKLVKDDALQRQALRYLDSLHTSFIAYDQAQKQRPSHGVQKSWLHSIFTTHIWEQESKTEGIQIPRSLYLWGSSGCGKVIITCISF
jgi:predicted ATPase